MLKTLIQMIQKYIGNDKISTDNKLKILDLNMIPDMLNCKNIYPKKSITKHIKIDNKFMLKEKKLIDIKEIGLYLSQSLK